MASIRIKVTQDHIDRGQRGNSCDCPIALALEGAQKDLSSFGHLTKASVGMSSVRLFFPQSTSDFLIPLEASRFVRRFDRGESVEPFEFELETTEI